MPNEILMKIFFISCWQQCVFKSCFYFLFCSKQRRSFCSFVLLCVRSAINFETKYLYFSKMEAKVIQGTCQSMCSKSEMKFRETNGLLHYFEIDHRIKNEVKACPEKIVKEYSRSAAGRSQISPTNLRPSPILLRTINYLIDEIIPSTEVPWVNVYDFVNDRIQAIRQDMTIQIIEDGNAVTIMEKCVRFYVLSSYILCEEPQNKFDQHLNSQQLTICLEKLFTLYEKIESKSVKDFISVYLSQNFFNNEVLYRSVPLFSNYWSDPTVKLSIEVSCAFISKNFRRFFQLVIKLPLIVQLSFFTHFPKIRLQALKSLCVGFSSPTCKIPMDILCSWLCLDKVNACQLCETCSVSYKNDIVSFNKKTFNPCLPVMKHEEFIDRILKPMSLSELINGLM